MEKLCWNQPQANVVGTFDFQHYQNMHVWRAVKPKCLDSLQHFISYNCYLFTIGRLTTFIKRFVTTFITSLYLRSFVFRLVWGFLAKLCHVQCNNLSLDYCALMCCHLQQICWKYQKPFIRKFLLLNLFYLVFPRTWSALKEQPKIVVCWKNSHCKLIQDKVYACKAIYVIISNVFPY